MTFPIEKYIITMKLKIIINKLIGGIVMPLSMLREGEPNPIRRIGGKEETRRFLENLGFVTGGKVTVVSVNGGNMIVNVKDSRVAIGRDMANKIMVG